MLQSLWHGCVQSLLVLMEGMNRICRQSNHIYASSYMFKMFKKIMKPAACEMWSVIRFWMQETWNRLTFINFVKCMENMQWDRRSSAQYLGTEKAFCLWNSCLKAQQSTQVSTATHLRNRVVSSRTSDVACLVGVLWCFMTMPAHTLPPQRKISLHIWLGTIWSSPVQPRLSAERFSCIPASENFPWCPAVPWRGQRSR
jgi:hypothetical protein